MKFATTFLMALSLGMLSLGCGDGGTESTIDPAGPDPALMGPSTDGEGITGSTDEANTKPGEIEIDDAKPDEAGDAKPDEGGDAKPDEAADAKPDEAADAKPAPEKKG